MARSRFRSVRYDLAASVEVARLVDAAGGTLGADLLAPALGYSGTNNGAYLARVATARLFGVVTGRGARFELTDRGRQILTGREPEAGEARREAFLAVPLFRAVAEQMGQTGEPLPEDLATWLVDGFGEVPDKARGVADRLVASAGQAGLLRRDERGNHQLTDVFTSLTPVEKEPAVLPSRRVGWRKGTGSAQGRDVAMTDDDLWLAEESTGGAEHRRPWRRVGVAAAAAAVLVAVAVPVALVASGSSSTPSARSSADLHAKLGNGPAEHQVLSALSATTDTGSFDFSYNLSSTPATATPPTTTPTTVCNVVKEPLVIPDGGGPSVSSAGGVSVPSAVGSSQVRTATATPSEVVGPASIPPGGVNDRAPTTGAVPPGEKTKTVRVCSGRYSTTPTSPSVQGSGVINTNPTAMVASANIASGLDVTVRVDGANLYEESPGQTGLAAPAVGESVTGASISGFAGLAEGTLGSREGAVAMLGLASPSGYLDLVQPAIDAAVETGTGTVDGVPVTNYQVTNDLDQLAGAAGTTSAEAQTITAALAVLQAQGYQSNSTLVSVDANGLIREVKAVDTFSDGGTVTLQSTFSNFGCAGTVLMPGQSGSGQPPTPCTPSTGASTTTTTTITAPVTVPTTIPTRGVTPTTVAVPDSSTTTTPTSTSTTVPSATTTLPAVQTGASSSP